MWVLGSKLKLPHVPGKPLIHQALSPALRVTLCEVVFHILFLLLVFWNTGGFGAGKKIPVVIILMKTYS